MHTKLWPVATFGEEGGSGDFGKRNFFHFVLDGDKCYGGGGGESRDKRSGLLWEGYVNFKN